MGIFISWEVARTNMFLLLVAKIIVIPSDNFAFGLQCSKILRKNFIYIYRGMRNMGHI